MFLVKISVVSIYFVAMVNHMFVMSMVGPLLKAIQNIIRIVPLFLKQWFLRNWGHNYFSKWIRISISKGISSKTPLDLVLMIWTLVKRIIRNWDLLWLFLGMGIVHPNRRWKWRLRILFSFNFLRTKRIQIRKLN